MWVTKACRIMYKSRVGKAAKKDTYMLPRFRHNIVDTCFKRDLITNGFSKVHVRQELWQGIASPLKNWKVSDSRCREDNTYFYLWRVRYSLVHCAGLSR
jgi:hypothetical protein